MATALPIMLRGGGIGTVSERLAARSQLCSSMSEQSEIPTKTPATETAGM